MRPGRIALALALQCSMFAAYAEDPPTTIEVDLASLESKAQIVDPDTRFSIRLLNVIPGEDYRIEPERRQIASGKLAASSDSAIPCDDPSKFLSAELRRAKTEAEVARVRETTFENCSDEQKSAAAAALAELADKWSLAVGEYKLSPGETAAITVRRGAARWQIVVTTNKVSADNNDDRLRQLAELLEKTPDLFARECSWQTRSCESGGIYVNLSEVSSVAVTHLPARGPVTVRVTAGESFDCVSLAVNEKRFATTPDTVVIYLHLRGGVPLRKHPSNTTGLRMYGWFDPDIATNIDTLGASKSPADEKRRTEVRKDVLCTTPLTQARFTESTTPELALVVAGKSSTLTVQFEWASGEVGTFTVPIRYARWWVDAGGLFAFHREETDSLVLEDKPDSKKLVVSKRRDSDIVPATGIAANFHPGNFPYFALQFGLSTSDENAPAYYFGAGARLMSIGRRGLLTATLGTALVQSLRFPGVAAGQTYPADSPRLDGTLEYDFQLYGGIVLGFSFGGVTNDVSRYDVTRGQ